VDATVHGPGDGEALSIGASEVVIKATGVDSGDTFFLSETTIEPGFPGPPPHRHKQLHDMFYVLEGTLTFRLGEETRELGPGSFACVPPGTVHTFSNPGEEPVRFLNFNTPSGWENYMRALGEAGRSGPLSAAEIGAIASRYDFEAVPPGS
jgi:quercetin dioxygenase-like cupin family protein